MKRHTQHMNGKYIEVIITISLHIINVVTLDIEWHLMGCGQALSIARDNDARAML